MVRRQASDTRKPAPYSAIRSARCFSDRVALSSRSISSWLSTVGKCLGRLGYGIFSAMNARPRVLTYKNRSAAVVCMYVAQDTFFSWTRYS